MRIRSRLLLFGNKRLSEDFCIVSNLRSIFSMKKILFIFFLLPSVLFAQWQEVFHADNTILTIHFLDKEGSPNTGFASYASYGTSSSTAIGILRTTDGGLTWMKVFLADSAIVATVFTLKDSLTGWYVSPSIFSDH